jgi:integrase/recombinase XerC
LKAGKVNITGKGDVSRNIYLSNPLLMRTINAYLKIRENTSVSLFTGRNGALTVRRVQQIWEKYCALTGLIGIGIHSLRHLYALEFMKANDNDILELQKRLGHKHRDTTEIYLVKKEENIREQIAKIK